MANRIAVKTTFEPVNVIEPIYTGGIVALSSNGKVLASTVADNAVLTDLNTGRRLAYVEGDGEAITTLALTPLASHLLLCSRSLYLRIFSIDAATDSEGLAVSLTRTLKPHNTPVITLAVDDTGTLFSTGSADGTVKVWDIRGGFTTHTFHGHGGVISAIHFFKVASWNADENRPKLQSRNHIEGSSGNGDEDDINASYRLASGSEDGKIRVWNLQKRKCIAVLDSHVSVVRALDFHNNTGMLLSGSRDKTVMLWSSQSWELHSTIPVLEAVETAGFIPQSPYIYTGGERGYLRLWYLESRLEATTEQMARSETQSIIQAICHHSLDFILCVHADQTLTLHSTKQLGNSKIATGFSPLPIERHISGTHDEVIDLAYVGPRQDYLAVATNLEEIRILSIIGEDKAQASLIQEPSSSQYFGADIGLLKGHSDIIICIDVDWSGHWLITGAKDNTARLWCVDPERGSFSSYATFTGHAESLGAVALPRRAPPVDSAAYNTPLEHPPEFVITGSQDKTIKKWETKVSKTEKSSRATYTRKAHDKDINALDVNHNSTLFASASQDRTVKIWSLEDGEAAGILRGHKRGVWSVKFAPLSTASISSETGQSSSGKGLVLTGSGDKSVKIWSLNDYSCLKTFEGHTNSVLKVLWMALPPPAMNGDGRNNSKQSAKFASSGSDGLVKIWDADAGEVECTLDNHTDRVWALALHRSGEVLASGGGDGVITFWKNTTSITMAAAVAESTARIEQDQELQNHIRQGSYRSAITLALQLNHPGRLFALFTSVVNKNPPEEGSLSGVVSVDEVLASLADEQLYLLLLRLRDWNANGKTAPVAQKILWTLLKIYPGTHLVKLRPSSGTKSKDSNIKDVFGAIKAYTERHYQRLEDLIDESYIVEYTLNEMDDLGLSLLSTDGKVDETAGVRDEERMILDSA